MPWWCKSIIPAKRTSGLKGFLQESQANR
jgi:hypothetical protein